MVNRDYTYSSIYSSISDMCLIPNSTYLYGYSTEGRSHVVDELMKRYYDVINFVQIENIEDESDTIIELSSKQKFYLRSKESIKSLLALHNSDAYYVDISGLNNRVSAALLNNLLTEVHLRKEVIVVYAEPETYKIKEFKSEGVYTDLSEKINGIEPLPGFANIIPDDVDYMLIALLGFEGGRFTHLVNNVQPAYDNIIPIVGVPGYRIEYPFVAFWGNRNALSATGSWANVRFADANSIVDVFFLLNRIHKKHPRNKIKLAPIGTKPHAIGAILYAIKHPKEIELVYDNPKRKIERTSGVGKIILCSASKLIKEL